ncbi:MAG: hypothetical protein E7Y34_01770, partial [Mycoplasma sp.]|nr:hypothetical protein [Mycoplasma sp.]
MLYFFSAIYSTFIIGAFFATYLNLVTFNATNKIYLGRCWGSIRWPVYLKNNSYKIILLFVLEMAIIFIMMFVVDYFLLKNYLTLHSDHAFVVILIISIIARILIIVYQWFTYKTIKHKMVSDGVALNEFRNLQANEIIVNFQEYSYLDLDIRVKNKSAKISSYYKKQITKFRDKSKEISNSSKKLVLFDYYIKWFAWMMVWKFEILSSNKYYFYYKNEMIDYQTFKLIILSS